MKNTSSHEAKKQILIPVAITALVMGGYTYLGLKNSIQFSSEGSNITLFLLPFLLWCWLISVWFKWKPKKIANLFALGIVPGLLSGIQFSLMVHVSSPTYQNGPIPFSAGFLVSMFYIGAICGVVTGILALLIYGFTTLFKK